MARVIQVEISSGDWRRKSRGAYAATGTSPLRRTATGFNDILRRPLAGGIAPPRQCEAEQQYTPALHRREAGVQIRQSDVTREAHVVRCFAE